MAQEIKKQNIIEVYDNHEMKVSQYEYDGTPEGEAEVKNKIHRHMMGATYYTVVK